MHDAECGQKYTQAKRTPEMQKRRHDGEIYDRFNQKQAEIKPLHGRSLRH